MRTRDTFVRVVIELSAARDLDALMTTARRAARKFTGADGATFVIRKGDTCHYADEDAIGPLWKGQRLPADTCITGWAMKHKRAAVVEDIHADSRIPQAAYESTFVRSLVVVPIRAADPIGAIGAYWARRHLATEREVRLLQALADSTAVAMDNVRSLDQARRWRALLEEASDTIWTVDAGAGSDELGGVGRWWADVTGRPIQSYSDKNGWLEDLHPEDRSAVAAAWTASLLSPVPFRTEYRVRAHDGSLRYVRARAVPVPRPGGSHELVGMISDVTRERQAEREAKSLLDRAREAKEALDQILERVTDGFVAIDRQWRYTYVSRRASEILGRKSEELIGEQVWTLFPEFLGGIFHRAMERAFATQQPVFEEAFFPPWRRWFENRIYVSDSGLSVFFTDVTEKRRAEEALEEARLRLDLAIQASNVGFWDWDPSGGEWRSTNECKRQLGYEPHDLEDSLESWQSLIHPDEREQVLTKFLAGAGDGVGGVQQEIRLRHRDGGYRWVLWRASGGQRVGGRTSHVRGCQVDVTDLKRAQEDRERLHRAAETEKRRLERLAECVPAGIVMVAAPSGRLMFSNRRATEVFGDSLQGIDEQLRRCGGQWPSGGETPLDVIAVVLETGAAVLDREVGCVSRGRRTRLLASAVPVVDDQGGLEAVVASFHDVTEGHEVREALRQLSRSLLTAHDEERRRISRDLHDDLGQVLTAVKMSLAALPPGVAPAAFDASVRNAIDIVDRSIRQTRDLSLQLHPPMLDVLGLGPTLRWHLAERLRNPSPVGHISIELGHNRFPPEIENACFRVIQEAVTNVLRHANARQIWVQVQEEAGALVMVVKDDGSGFEVVTARARASAQGAGLAGMQERVALAGGSFELRSKPGEGTLIRARVPLGTGK